MKSNTLYSLALGILCLFAACSEKEGTYSPKKQIEQVYYSSSTVQEKYNDTTGYWEITAASATPKVLAETWVWEEGLLKNITYHSEVTPSGEEQTVSFTYVQNRVNQIETANERITFTYNGNRLRTAELFDKKLGTLTPYQTFYFYYDGTHLSQIEVFIHENAKSKTPRLLQDHWTTYMHETMGVTPLALDMAKNKAEAAKRVVSEVINLTWQGENVSSMYTEDEYSSLKVDYTYDEKNNPLHHFLYTLSGMYASEGVEFVNKNNITKALSTFTLQELDYEEVQQSEVNYLYSYTNDWPVEKQVVKVYGDEEEGYRTTERFVYYYEYSN